MGTLPRTPIPTRRPERFRQATSALLRQLNLLIVGADVEELQDIVATLVTTQAYATARLIEERRSQRAAVAANVAARDGGRAAQAAAGNGAPRPAGNGGPRPTGNGGVRPAGNGGMRPPGNGGVRTSGNGEASAAANGGSTGANGTVAAGRSTPASAAVAVPAGRTGNGSGRGPGRLGTR